MNSKFPVVSAVVLSLFLAASSAQATNVQFAIDPSLSSLTIISSIDLFGTPFQVTPQGSGSFTASYSGSIFADITPTSIQLLSPSTLVAGISGDWRPGTDYSNYPGDNGNPNGYANSAEPANYGLVTDLTPLNGTISISAVRDLEIGLSDPAPKPLVAGAFSEVGISTDFTSGTIYYGSGAAPPITDLANTTSPDPTVDAIGEGTLTTVGSLSTLTIPVQFTVNYNIAVLTVSTTYTGTIVATSVPEPRSMLMLATLGLPCLLRPQRS